LRPAIELKQVKSESTAERRRTIIIAGRSEEGAWDRASEGVPINPERVGLPPRLGSQVKLRCEVGHSVVGTRRAYSTLTLSICSAALMVRFVSSPKEASMSTFMLLTFLLVFLLGVVTGAWLNAITVRSR
jgi:hypothetical protein